MTKPHDDFSKSLAAGQSVRVLAVCLRVCLFFVQVLEGGCDLCDRGGSRIFGSGVQIVLKSGSI